ncbi:MAG: hypothetical protein LBI90_08805 [Treponema sp.]|jgi:hypothetical protein|nr:hypothetical protein [Treponema sp.]
MLNKLTSWDDLEFLPVEKFQRGVPDDAAAAFTGKLYEEPLLVQSNARILIGHGVNGMFRFAAYPSRIYPVPINCSDFGFGQGMFYHTDNAVYLGDCYYSLISGGKRVNLTGPGRAVETRYGLHFLPMTRTTEGTLKITITSCAPVAEKGAAAFRGIPLPGPAGAIYSITIKNTSADAAEGILCLNVSGTLIGDYEDLGAGLRDINKAEIRVRRDTLIVSRPEGSAGVHLQGGKLIPCDSDCCFELPYAVPPGESCSFAAYIVMGLVYNDIMEELYRMMRRDPLDWISSTVTFWQERLPQIELSSPDSGDLTDRLGEFFIRCLLDNFNCLQTDREGNLIAHRQGAPSHGFGTVWGIDYEPTIISAAMICPELAERALVFLLDRTRPTASYCKPNHSVPILCAPVVIAAYLLRQTGDLGLFTRTPQIPDALTGIMEEILAYKHQDETLFATYWSSDGLTGRRYDYGTNVKLFYAFKGLAYILNALGRDGTKYDRTAGEILKSIEKTMLIDGPFGIMLSGGTNLDSGDEGMFIKDNRLPYYDGEDTSTMLAPVYGACEDDYAPLVNYQRFGRSIFCENYQAETDLRTWFAVPPLANDGTAVLASLSGAVSRNEMIDTGNTALRFIDPVTGSLWWWPNGWKEHRKLTRCSQGQGAWAWQYRSRWLGVETDALSHSLFINPKGLPSKLHIRPSKSMGLPFEIEYDETAGECKISNTDDQSWNVQAAFRKPGCGAEGERDTICGVVPPKGVIVLKNETKKTGTVKPDVFSRRDIVRREMAAFGRDGILFTRRGGLWFWLQSDKPAFDLRFIIGNGTGSDWKDVKVTLHLPKGCSASGRGQGMMVFPNDTAERQYRQCVCHVGTVPAEERTTASFTFHMPLLRRIHQTKLNKSRHLFETPPTNDALITTRDITAPDIVSLTADLEALSSDGKPVKRSLEFKAGYMPDTDG